MKSDTKRNIRLDISYDGTDFQGWQVQTSDRTVQGELEKALAKLHGHKVNLTAPVVPIQAFTLADRWEIFLRIIRVFPLKSSGKL